MEFYKPRVIKDALQMKWASYEQAMVRQRNFFKQNQRQKLGKCYNTYAFAQAEIQCTIELMALHGNLLFTIYFSCVFSLPMLNK